jgi:quinol monooxygenase YgiN
MVHTIARFQVENFEKFKQVYESRTDLRAAAGSKGSQILIDPSDSKAVTLIEEWSSQEDFKKFMGRDDMKGAMKDATILGPPDIQLFKNID